IHPPFFYFLLKIWIAVGGESLFWLRLFPVTFSIVAVVPFLLLCRQLKLSFPAIAAALAFFAANGSLIKYAQGVRMYSLLLCAGLFSLWLFVRFVNMGKGFPTLLVVNVLLVYTHYFGWLIVASEVLAAAILARHRLKYIVLMCAVTLASFAPWIYAVWEASKINSNVGQNIGWMAKPNISSVFRFVFDLFEPIYFEQSNIDASVIILITLPIIVVGIIAFGFYFAGWRDESEAEKRNFYLAAIFFLTPILLAFTASWILPYSVWGTRHLIIVFAPFLILPAIAFSKIKNRQLQTAGLGLVFLLFGAALLLQATRAEPKYIWCAWENLARNLDEKQPAKIYVFEDLVAYHFWFARRDSDGKFQVVKINGIENLIEDKAYFLPRGFGEIQTANDFEGERFFIAFRDKNWNEFAPPLQNLKAQNYKIGEPQIFEAQGLKAFLAEVWKIE
ncbi:MAG: glycosyltransferase family 39 protein, partial [Pyrinomonadaceae bacterium]|nr:glycosyltransferase family 39 protein [Pyrinomonadaceae bacterium]